MGWVIELRLRAIFFSKSTLGWRTELLERGASEKLGAPLPCDASMTRSAEVTLCREGMIMPFKNTFDLVQIHMFSGVRYCEVYCTILWHNEHTVTPKPIGLMHIL